jgi:hypothetical protein
MRVAPATRVSPLLRAGSRGAGGWQVQSSRGVGELLMKGTTSELVARQSGGESPHSHKDVKRLRPRFPQARAGGEISGNSDGTLDSLRASL